MKNNCYRKTYYSDSYPTFKWCKQKGKISKLKLLETESLENGYFSVKSLEKNFKFGKIKGGEGGEGEKEKLNALEKKKSEETIHCIRRHSSSHKQQNTLDPNNEQYNRTEKFHEHA